MSHKKRASWVDLHAHPGYRFSDHGRIKDKHNNQLSIHLGGDGATWVRLRVPGNSFDWFQSDKLTARAHVGPKPTPWHNVAHINGDRADNRAENLVWVEDAFDFYRGLMRRPSYVKPWRDEPGDYLHGRVKVAETCRRGVGHALSMTGEPDGNTSIHGYGNRICRRCWREDLDDVVAIPHAGGGRW